MNASETQPMSHMMWMYFHTKISDTVLFEFWMVNTPKS